MALSKVTYVDGVTIIGAKNLNDIQDELIRQGEQQAEDEAELALKANAENVQTALALKADKSDTYTKAEVNEALGLKANTADVNEALALKADKTETYTKAQVDSIVEDAIAEAVKESEYSNFEMKSVSGDFIHITDGAGLIPVKDLKIGIDAVQDLHGYDAPWVGGAGKNLIAPIATTTNYGVTFSQDGDYIDINGTATENAYVYLYNGVLPAGDYVVNGMDGESSSAWRLGVKLGSASWTYSAGNPKMFTTDGETTVIVALFAYAAHGEFSHTKVQYQLEKGSTPSAWTPYSNICPISGWTGAKVTVQGVNQWDEEWELGSINTSTGAKITSTNIIRSKNMIRVEPNTAYCIAKPLAQILAIFYDEFENPLQYSVSEGDQTTVFNLAAVFSAARSSAIFTTPSNANYMMIRYDGVATYSNNISINYPSTDTDYHAYNGNTYEVTWEDEAGTVYGGTLDVTTGELVVTDASVTFDGSDDETWVKFGSGSASAFAMATPFNHAFVVSNNNLIANYLKSIPTTATWGNENGWISAQNNGSIMTGIKSITEVADWRTYLSNNPLQVVYELTTPQTYQLTPTEVLTLLGENNIFADTGAVEELIYRISRQ